jgi:hypothetical protein
VENLPFRKTRVFKPLSVLLVVALISVFASRLLDNSSFSKQTKITDRKISRVHSHEPDVSLENSPIGTSTLALANWLNAWRETPSERLLEEGLELAEQRRARMAHLISSDPGLAIDSMLSFQDYLDLPIEIKEIIEQPFAFG